MKKSSAKNFLSESFWEFFKNSTLNRDLFSVERFAFYLVGVCGLKFNITNIEFGCRHLIRHLTVTPSPTGEGNRTALFRQQIFNASVGERLDATKGSLREGAVERM